MEENGALETLNHIAHVQSCRIIFAHVGSNAIKATYTPGLLRTVSNPVTKNISSSKNIHGFSCEPPALEDSTPQKACAVCGAAALN